MKLIGVAAALVLGMSCLAGENLVRNGDFSRETGEALYPECGVVSGRLDLVTEKENGNRCGKLSVEKISQDGRFNVASACAWIGGHKDKGGGFEVLPNTVYEFSLRIRGTAPSIRIGSMNWNGDELWKNMQSAEALLELVEVTGEWQEIRGTFKTGPRVWRAALRLQMWSSTKNGALRYQPGDYVLFDDVKVAPKVY